MLSGISCQHKIIANWNFEHEPFEYLSMGVKEIGVPATQKSLNIPLSFLNGHLMIDDTER